MPRPKPPELTAERLRELLNYDPETGVFTRRVATGGRYGAAAGTVAGTEKDGYVVISVHSKLHRAHRLAWFYMTGKWPEHDIDHEDTSRANNRWKNLREAPGAINAQNKRRAQRNSKTGLLGVSWSERDQLFTARIKIGCKYVTLGYSKDDPHGLHQRYLEAKRQHHAGCTI